MIFNEIEKLRREKGITQSELAKLIGFTSDGFRNSLKNNKLPADALAGLAQFFSVPVGALFGETADQPQNQTDRLLSIIESQQRTIENLTKK